jgi:hypothetical protein
MLARLVDEETGAADPRKSRGDEADTMLGSIAVDPDGRRFR